LESTLEDEVEPYNDNSEMIHLSIGSGTVSPWGYFLAIPHYSHNSFVTFNLLF